MVDEIVTRQELIDAKRDARDLGKAVNENVIVDPRYGDDFKSLPMISAEGQAIIDSFDSEAQVKFNEWESAIALITQQGGVPALAVSDSSGMTQQEINNKSILRVQDISSLKSYTPRLGGEFAIVKNYDNNVLNINNTYVYVESSTLDNNYGTVIASDVVGGRWLMLPKDEYYPRDFGVQASVSSVENDAKLEAYLNSQLPLKLDVGTYSFSVHKNIGEVPLNIKGRGYDKSVIERVSIFIKTSNNYLADFRINTLSNNYSVLIKQGSYNKIERVYAYDNYDSFAAWQQFTDQTESKNNRFIDCIAEKSRRIGFTTDLRANRTFFENCTAIDCRQGFHMEGSKDSFIIKATAMRCGLLSPTGVGEQDSYAGSLRSYGVDGLYVDGFENIDPAGTNYWQHGGAVDSSKNLVFKNMRGMGSLILDPTAEITENMHFENVENLGMYIEGFLQSTVGRIVVKDCHQTVANVAPFMVTGNPSTDIYVSNSTLGTVSLSCRNLFLNNLQTHTATRHGIKAVNIESTGLLSSYQTTYQDNAGFLFDMAVASRFKFEVLRLDGVSGGTHLAFTNFTALPKLLNFGDLQKDVATGVTINGVAASGADLVGASVQIGVPKIYRSDALPTSGFFNVGDMILKNTVGVDTIYGWVCTTGGAGAAVVWHPLKYSV